MKSGDRVRATEPVSPRLPAGSTGEVLDPNVDGTIMGDAVAKVRFDALPHEPYYVQRSALEPE